MYTSKQHLLAYIIYVNKYSCTSYE